MFSAQCFSFQGCKNDQTSVIPVLKHPTLTVWFVFKRLKLLYADCHVKPSDNPPTWSRVIWYQCSDRGLEYRIVFLLQWLPSVWVRSVTLHHSALHPGNMTEIWLGLMVLETCILQQRSNFLHRWHRLHLSNSIRLLHSEQVWGESVFGMFTRRYDSHEDSHEVDLWYSGTCLHRQYA